MSTAVFTSLNLFADSDILYKRLDFAVLIFATLRHIRRVVNVFNGRPTGMSKNSFVIAMHEPNA